jgi:hypothetical protein
MRFRGEPWLFPGILAIFGCDNAGEGAPAAMRTAVLPSSVPSASTAAKGPPPGERDRVTLDGAFHAPGVQPADAGPRIHAKALRAWIYARPTPSSERLGYLRAGSSSPTRGAAGTEGCSGGWYAIEPEGFVCVGPTATLDAKDPVVVLSASAPASFERKLPFIYGTVRNPGPVYARLPSGDELARAEPDLAERMPAWLDAAGEIGASFAQDVWLGRPGVVPDPRLAWNERRTDPMPELRLKGGVVRPTESGTDAGSELVLGRMRPKVGYSFLSTALFEGRRYGLATDLSVLPTDRLRPIRGSEFRGVEIGKDIALPFAFVRRDGARFWRFDRKRNRLEEAGEAAYRAAVALTGKRQFFRGRLHEETTDGRWLSDQDASRIDPAKRMPAWGKNGERVCGREARLCDARLDRRGRARRSREDHRDQARDLPYPHQARLFHHELGRGR